MAGSLLVCVFVLAAQLVPVVHLATHRNDHTHGPEFDASVHGHADRDHDRFDAHDDVVGHDHGDDHDLAANLDPAEHADVPNDRQTPPSDRRRSGDHGQASVAHFGVALLQGPPPPFLPPPAETLALPADVVRRSHRAAPRRQSPARGPPRLV